MSFSRWWAAAGLDETMRTEDEADERRLRVERRAQVDGLWRS